MQIANVHYFSLEFANNFLPMWFSVEFANVFHCQCFALYGTIFDVKDYVLSLSSNERLIISEVCMLLRLILVMPSTNAVSERSFSALKRIKTYLQSTMSQDKSNYLLLLHLYKELTYSLDLIAVANDFVADSWSEYRLSVFGYFTESDGYTGGFCFKCKSLLKYEVPYA